MTHDPPGGDLQRRLGELFGSYKAEWLRDDIFRLFTEPRYWPELETHRPCMLVGGRGTGKTTALRGLSYQGQYALRGGVPAVVGSMDYFGLYERVDTNRVRAFAGPELPEEQWDRIFAHYLNLAMVRQVVTFLSWYTRTVGIEGLLSRADCSEVALSLNLRLDSGETDLPGLAAAVRRAVVHLEVQINNIGDDLSGPRLSLQKAPVDLIMEALNRALPGKRFFFILDEYENFSIRQQRVVNTLIKHGGTNWTFKVGVRELGFRSRETINADEQLTSPADYVYLSVEKKFAGKRFNAFAANVCAGRLAEIRLELPASAVRVDGGVDIAALLPALSQDEEARALGAARLVDRDFGTVREMLSAEEVKAFRREPLLWQLVALRRSSTVHDRVADIRRYVNHRDVWADRVNNYGYSLLFSINRGSGSGGIQKYYAGWDTYCAMAAGNIRYLLELVEQALLAHLEADGDLRGSVSPRVQTLSARSVGLKNLGELEGLSVHGAKLTKLVLGLGRVFQLLAHDPEGHTAEVTEFEVLGLSEGTEADELLQSAVRHLALLRAPGTKLSNAPSETKDYDFRLHPIFSAFFGYSYRKKRKVAITAERLLLLVSEPRDAIASMVEARDRRADEKLPEQLALFSGYYGVGAA
jgi:hypothetical protein